MADVTVVAKDVRVLPGGATHRKVAAAAAPPGSAVYIAADARVDLADADAAPSSMAVGIVVSAPRGGLTNVAGDTLDIAGPGCLVTGFTGLTPGTLVYASTTGGAIADTRPAGSSGDFAWVIGMAWDATTILVMPFSDIFAAL